MNRSNWESVRSTAVYQLDNQGPGLTGDDWLYGVSDEIVKCGGEGDGRLLV